MLLLLGGAGDELQGIKKGVLEWADILAVNKADGAGERPARLAQRELTQALHYGQALAAWNCGFEGARGGMYASTRNAFQKQIAKLLEGGTPALPTSAKATVEAESLACPACVA